MKTKNSESKFKSESNFKSRFKSKFNFKLNAVKIIAIVVIALFVLMLIGGMVKFHQIKSSFVEITEEQSVIAKAIVLQDMESRAKNVSNYELYVIPNLRMMKEKEVNRLITQVQVLVKPVITTESINDTEVNDSNTNECNRDNNSCNNETRKLACQSDEAFKDEKINNEMMNNEKKEDNRCPFGFDKESKQMMGLGNSQYQEFYVVDLVANKILMHTETQFYEAPLKEENNPRWFHGEMFK